MRFIQSYYSPSFATTGYVEVMPGAQLQAGINIQPFNWNDSGNNFNQPNAKAIVLANTWYEYALTWGSEGLHYYIDGNLVYSNSNTGAQNPNTSWWAVGDENSNGFNGVMDELRISNIQRDFASVPEPATYIPLIVVLGLLVGIRCTGKNGPARLRKS